MSETLHQNTLLLMMTPMARMTSAASMIVSHSAGRKGNRLVPRFRNAVKKF